MTTTQETSPCALKPFSMPERFPGTGNQGFLNCAYLLDTKALLSSTADTPHLFQIMDIFEDASNQRLNHDKLELLPLGSLAPIPPPHTTFPLRVVPVATGLGIRFSLSTGIQYRRSKPNTYGGIHYRKNILLLHLYYG